MGFVKRVRNLSEIKEPEVLQRYLSIAIDDITEQVNGRLVFRDNILADGPKSVTFPGATIATIAHSLGRVPQGYLEIDRNAAITTFSPSGASFVWTTTTIYLQASGAGVVDLYVI